MLDNKTEPTAKESEFLAVIAANKTAMEAMQKQFDDLKVQNENYKSVNLALYSSVEKQVKADKATEPIETKDEYEGLNEQEIINKLIKDISPALNRK